MGLFRKSSEDPDEVGDLLPPLQSAAVLEVSRSKLLPVVERALPDRDRLLSAKMAQWADGTYPYLYNAPLELLDTNYLIGTLTHFLELTWGRDASSVMLIRLPDGTFPKDDDVRHIAGQTDFYIALSRRELVERTLGPEGATRMVAELDLLPEDKETWLFNRVAIDEFAKVVSHGLAKRAKRLLKRH